MNFANLIPYLILALAPLPILSSIWGAYQAAQVAEWPTVEGDLTAVSLEEKKDRSDTNYEVKVAYQYSVNGKTYDGDQIAMGYVGFKHRERHDEIQRTLAKGKRVMVRYDPARPEIAYLAGGITRGVQEGLLNGAIISLFLTFFSLLLRMGMKSEQGNPVLDNLITE